jgi:peptidoglycan/xylan/chitin deacetylase (PgdA/CDA1 family)
MTARIKPGRIGPLVVAIVASLFVSFFANVALASFATGSTGGGNNNFPCNCVIFRMDDVTDDNRAMPAMAVMDAFISRNQDLSLGIIMNNFGNNSQLLSKIIEGRNKGLFELDIHGWNHVDYSVLSQDMQASTMAAAKEKMYKLFGETPSIFIPPFNRFNDDTIKAMARTPLTIISSDVTHDSNGSMYFVADGNAERSVQAEVSRLPAATYFGVVGSDEKTWTNLSETQIISQAKLSIAKYGYAVILLHPQSYLLTKDGRTTNTLDNMAISELYGLIDSFSAQNVRITTFSKTVQFRPQVSIVQAKFGGEDYDVTGKSSYAKVTSISIVPERSIQVGVEGQGRLELTLTKGMISGVYSVSADYEKEVQFQQQHDASGATVVSFDVPSSVHSFSISGAQVVPEFPSPLIAIAVASALCLIAAKSRRLRRSCP